jgi:hypothetical protein
MNTTKRMKLLAALVGGSALVAMGALTIADEQAGATTGFENVDVTSAIQSTPATASAAPALKGGDPMLSEESLVANPMVALPPNVPRGLGTR